ncbi:MAG: 1-acyl-sn-glycerol-3-phosphate acyltransferase, partial [Alphaproteobacteria bacterium]
WARVWPLSTLIRSMGAYFIRRRSRGALYRKVLARYVQMATTGGVTQAFYPEGGLSLTGALQPPKVGLLSYVVEGFDPEGERDIIFVPVAINYDRILEDRVLIAAGERGDRRFGARITVVVGFVLRKIWRRMRGRDTRFGTAAVTFGDPLSLRRTGADVPVSDLSEMLMDRIAQAMPVLTVPLIARVMLRAKGPLSEAELLAKVAATLEQMPLRNRVPKPDVLPDRVARATARLKKRGVISEDAQGLQIAAGQEPVLAFYANSIAHFPSEDAAPAAEIAATAGS